jgi:choline dehydrogenase-like flavoprotein
MTDDIIIIGTGAGGGALAFALRQSGAKVRLIERGDFLPQEKENWSPEAVIGAKRYQADDVWRDADSGKPFRPGTYYFVGGNTKMYGAAFPRFRLRDFDALEHEEGTSPAWPISYETLDPYYAEAENIFWVHGQQGEDNTEPPRSTPYPFPNIPHEPYAREMMTRLREQGFHPFSLPMGLDLRVGGRCIRCETCDGFPCKLHAKADAEVCLVRPALQSPGVLLQTRTLARKLLTNASGKQIVGVEVEQDGEVSVLRAKTFVVACGATNSAALLLRSANDKHPNGLANASGLVGRNYMAHMNSTLIAIDPTRRNDDVFSKTIAVNDFYFGSPRYPYPMGNLQILGKIQASGYIARAKPILTKNEQDEMSKHSADWWVMSEDLPDPENRVMLDSQGRIVVRRRFKNSRTHTQLVQHAEDMLRSIGFSEIIHTLMPVETNSHQCGTLRFGDDPATSVLDPFCKAWEVENLYVVDASFFPSSTAMNPALTIAAMALRVGKKITNNIS